MYPDTEINTLQSRYATAKGCLELSLKQKSARRTDATGGAGNTPSSPARSCWKEGMTVALLGKRGMEEAGKIGGHGCVNKLRYWGREVAQLVQGLTNKEQGRREQLAS